MIDFKTAWDQQTDLHNTLIQLKKAAPDGSSFQQHYLLLCEHPHVFTLGKSGKESHLLQPAEKMDEIQAEYHRINRGGDITYHGPGQLVVYPILDLEKLFTDVHKYVRFLEQVIIELLADYDLNAGRIPGLTGVWLDTTGPKPKKICAIGVHLSRWVSLHGLAFNINTQLDYFNYIVPCGIPQSTKSVTSLAAELGAPQNMREVKDKFTEHFLHTFNLWQIK